MAEQRVTLAQLVDQLRGRAAYRHERNLILVALPMETAHRDGPALARALGADYLDFDCELLARMEADDWEDHVALERRGTLSVGRNLADEWLREDVARRIQRERPLVIGNVNLAVRYDVDVAGALYEVTSQGLCVIAAGGRIQGQALLIHGTFQQTGAGSPAYEVVPPSDCTTPASPPTVQERLL